MAKSGIEKQLEELEKLHNRGTLTEEEYAARRQAVLSDTSTPAPQKQGRGGIFKWGALGCLGIFGAIGAVVIGIIVVIAVAIGSSGDDTPDSGGDVRVPLAVGSTGVISPEGNGSKKSQVTIVQIVDSQEAGLEAPSEGKKYWGVFVEVVNVGTAEINGLDWMLRDSTNTESEETYSSEYGELLDPLFTLTPGGKTEGWVLFEIAADASPQWLRADPNPFLKDDLYFDAAQ